MPSPLQGGKEDVQLIVWVGVIGLLFLAVALHEGWIGGGASIAGNAADGLSPAAAADAENDAGGFFQGAGDAVGDIVGSLIP
jgi:hypothetical protein